MLSPYESLCYQTRFESSRVFCSIVGYIQFHQLVERFSHIALSAADGYIQHSVVQYAVLVAVQLY